MYGGRILGAASLTVGGTTLFLSSYAVVLDCFVAVLATTALSLSVCSRFARRRNDRSLGL